jgi:hypothetical protein
MLNLMTEEQVRYKPEDLGLWLNAQPTGGSAIPAKRQRAAANASV